MGGIIITTQVSSVTKRNISLSYTIPSSDVIGKFRFIPQQNVTRKTSQGLKNVKIYDNFPLLTVFDKETGWNNFMEIIHNYSTYTTSKIIPLPFLNSTPIDYNTIYSVLSKVSDDNRNRSIL